MPDETVVAAPTVEGVSEGTESQGSAPASQDVAQNQSTVEPQVESVQPQATRQDAGRPRASDFYKIRQLEKMYRDLNDKYTQLSQVKTESPAPAKESPVDPKDFYEKPVDWLLKREKQLREEITKDIFEKRFPELLDKSLTQRDQAQGFKKQSQEALELMFPKTSPTSNEPLEARMWKDESKAQRMVQLLRDTGLDKLSESEPVKAANLALELYAIRYPAEKPRSQNAIKKTQMGSTATGSPIGGGQKMPTIQELQTKQEELMKKMSDKPEVRFDENFLKEFNFVKEELVKLHSGNIVK